MDQCDLAAQLWKTTEQEAKRFESFRNPLGVVHAIHAQDKHVVKQLFADIRGPGGYVGMRGRYGEFFEVNADGESSHHRVAPLHPRKQMRMILLDGSFGEQTLEAAHKIVAVTVGLETNQVELKQRLQNALQKESHAGARSCFAQISRHAHQAIIMYPDEIVVRGSRGGGLGKFAIDPLIGFPIIGIELAE